MAVSDMKKLYSSLLIFTPIRKVLHIFQKFMSVSITFVAINTGEILVKDFILKYFLEVKKVRIRTGEYFRGIPN